MAWSPIVGNPTYGSIHCIQCAVTGIRSACHSFFCPFLYTYLPNIFRILCTLSPISVQAWQHWLCFASQFSISGSDLRRTCSTLLCWCSASHARCPAIEANSSIKCDYDPSLSSLFPLPSPPPNLPSAPSVPAIPQLEPSPISVGSRFSYFEMRVIKLVMMTKTCIMISWIYHQY